MRGRPCCLVVVAAPKVGRKAEERLRHLEGGEDLAKLSNLTVVHMEEERPSVVSGSIAPPGERATIESLWREFVADRGLYPIFAVSREVAQGAARTLFKLRQSAARESEAFPPLILPLAAVSDAEDARGTPFDLDPDGWLRHHVERGLRGTDGPILLIGETGTGKTEMARWVHQRTRCARGQSPFRVVNCGALQKNEREALFRGVTKGAFTGVDARPSIFEQCDGGTVLLDDFQDLSPQNQAALLDLLDPFTTRVSGYRQGAEKAWDNDVQVILAVNRPLEDLLPTGRLRRDIYFRVPRQQALPTLRSLLETPESSDMLRLLLLRLQEDAVQFNARDPWTAEVSGVARVERFLVALGLSPGRSGAFELPSSPTFREVTPIPAELRTHAWPGNFRQLAFVARELMGKNDRRVGRWASANLEDVLARSSMLGLAPGGAPLAQPHSLESESPARLLAVAHLRAIDGTATIAGASRALRIDRRTLRKLLQKTLDGEEETVDQLTMDERKRFLTNARRLLDAGG